MNNYGTGSYPPDAVNGWHLKILFTKNTNPLYIPCPSMASSAYSEQEG
jgi:hypothetical protein